MKLVACQKTADDYGWSCRKASDSRFLTDDAEGIVSGERVEGTGVDSTLLKLARSAKATRIELDQAAVRSRGVDCKSISGRSSEAAENQLAAIVTAERVCTRESLILGRTGQGVERLPRPSLWCRRRRL